MNCGCDLGVEMHDANNKTIQLISESVVLRFRSGSGVLYCNNITYVSSPKVSPQYCTY